MIENMEELEVIAEDLDEVLFLEPRSTFDRAIVGMAYRACGKLAVVAYDRDKCIEAMAKDNDWSEEDAEEFFEFNTAGAWLGEGTPVFIDRLVEVPAAVPAAAPS